nr:MAG TPA: hypothetical protein [Bacteriophage sp.]DAN86661.1 MAG TPA: hypothetical protein [Caudoviricetes sp.]
MTDTDELSTFAQWLLAFIKESRRNAAEASNEQTG